MRLLFDENLSPELVEALADYYPDSQHVHDRGLGSSDDRDVWEYAKSFGFVIVTKDTDFYNRSIRVGAPPRVVWIRLGNCPTGMLRGCCGQGVRRCGSFLRTIGRVVWFWGESRWANVGVWRGGYRATPPVTKCCHGWGTRDCGWATRATRHPRWAGPPAGCGR